MSRENVELVRAAIEDFFASTSESDREAMLTRNAAVWDPEVVWDASEIPWPDLAAITRGKEAVRRWWGEFLAAWEIIQAEYELADAGDYVVALFDQQMR